MSEDHGANRKDGRTDPNDDGGFLLGNAWRRFHDRITVMGSLGSCAATGSANDLGQSAAGIEI